MRRGLAVVVLSAVSVLPAGAARFAGEWSNAFSGTTGRVRFIGRLQPGATAIGGKLRCRRCPVRGRLQLSCAPTGECTGTAATGCSVEGYYYGTQFEGQYACGSGLVGALSFGRR